MNRAGMVSDDELARRIDAFEEGESGPPTTSKPASTGWNGTPATSTTNSPGASSARSANASRPTSSRRCSTGWTASSRGSIGSNRSYRSRSIR
ncbi:hypothetical protein [Halosegnis marinus]|uniref:hypothetical protein n=1 Tax=Halosegnis marinus TaxID=3034023 RepID=UPI0036179AC4